jgi:hypothetical protein
METSHSKVISSRFSTLLQYNNKDDNDNDNKDDKDDNDKDNNDNDNDNDKDDNKLCLYVVRHLFPPSPVCLSLSKSFLISLDGGVMDVVKQTQSQMRNEGPSSNAIRTYGCH